MDPVTLERLATAYVRRQTFEGQILATQVMIQLGAGMKPPEKEEGERPSVGKKIVQRVSSAELLGMMGLDINAP